MSLCVPSDSARWADISLGGARLRGRTARAVLAAPDEGILDLVAAAFRVRRAHFGPDGSK